MKNIIIIIIAILSVTSCKKPDGKISGVVTYYFNTNYGDKPDVGANIYIISKKEYDDTKAKVIDRFCSAVSIKHRIDGIISGIKSDSSLIIEYQKMGKKYGKSYKETIDEMNRDIEHYKNQMNISLNDLKSRLNINSNDELDTLFSNARNEIYSFQSKSHVRFVADGNGGYSTNLPPGEYYVMIRSNHRDARNDAEILGQIYFGSVKIESEKESTQNANFSRIYNLTVSGDPLKLKV